MTIVPRIGDTISYKLRTSEQPRNPERLWHGVIEWALEDWYRVRLTDRYYEGIRDIVVGQQIVEINPLEKLIDV
jgi:hypothetical protein